MEHSPLKPEAIEWMLDRVSSRDLSPVDIARRSKTAEREKRYADVVAQWRALLETKPDDKVAKKAEAELGRLEKLGLQRLDEAEKKVEKEKETAKKLLGEIARQFAGLDCAVKAAGRLDELK
jgi:hypothetical protein